MCIRDRISPGHCLNVWVTYNLHKLSRCDVYVLSSFYTDVQTKMDEKQCFGEWLEYVLFKEIKLQIVENALRSGYCNFTCESDQ